MNGLKFWNALKFGIPSFLKPHAYLDILLKKDINNNKCDGLNSFSSTFPTSVTIYLHHPHLMFYLSII